MAHKRGQITAHNDCIFKEGTYYKIYTGCEWLDDYYIAESLDHAEKISKELKEKNNAQ
jgi:hypothetical protein